MRLFGYEHHKNDRPWDEAPIFAIELACIGLAILERMDTMATQAQLDKLKSDVAALISAAVDEISAAVAAAQAVPPAQADAAIDTLDQQVTATTQSLTDAAAKLRLPPAAPTP